MVTKLYAYLLALGCPLLLAFYEYGDVFSNPRKYRMDHQYSHKHYLAFDSLRLGYCLDFRYTWYNTRISFYRWVVGDIHLNLDFTAKYLLAYQGIFGTLIGLIFARRREQGFNVLWLRNRHLTETQQKTRKELVQALNYHEELLQELNPEEIVFFDATTTAYIKQAIYHVKDYLRLEVSKFSIDLFLEEV